MDPRDDIERLIASAAQTVAAHLPPARPRMADGSRYEIRDRVGVGGMGEVWRAFDTSLRRAVAVKIPRARLLPADHVMAEARVLAGLDHPAIVPIHEVAALSDGSPCIVMKFVAGDTLGALLARRAPRADEERYLGAFGRVCEAVAEAHALQQPVLHRDLKPSNIMVGSAGVFVLDWGIARWLTEAADPAPAVAAKPGAGDAPTPHAGGSPTRTGDVKGTPGYMAPEQARGETSVGPACDVFGLGGLLCEILTGEPSYPGTALPEEIRGHLEVTFGRLDGCGADAELIALANRCLQYNATDRPADAGRVAAEFAAAQTAVQARLRGAENERRERAIRETAELRHRARRKWLVRGLLTAAVLLLGTAIAWAVRERGVALQFEQKNKGLKDLTDDLREQKERLEDENTRRRAALREASELAFGRGSELAESGNPRDGVLWMARALTFSAEAGDDDLGKLIRRNLTAWRPELPVTATRFRNGPTFTDPVFSPSGARLLTIDGTAGRCWDARTGECLQPSLPHPAKVVAHSLLDDHTALTVDAAGVVRHWDVRTGEASGAKTLACKENVGRVTIHRASLTLRTHAGGDVRLWDARTGAPRGPACRHAPHTDRPSWESLYSNPLLSPDGKTLCTLSSATAVRLVDGLSGSAVGPPLVHDDPVTTAAFSPDGRTILTGDKKGAIRIWSAETGLPLHEPRSQTGEVRSILFNHAGTAFVTLGTAISYWSLADGPKPLGKSNYSGDTQSVAFSPDDRYLVRRAGSNRLQDGDRIVLAHLPTLQPAGPVVTIDTENRYRLEFSPDRKHLLIVGGRNAFLWQIPVHLRPGVNLVTEDSVKDVAVSPDGTQVVVGCESGTIRTFDTKTGRPAGPTVERPAPVGAVAWAPGGKTWYAASGRWPRKAELWDIRSRDGDAGAVRIQHDDDVQQMAVCADGSRLLTRSAFAVRYWDIGAGGRLLFPPLKHLDNRNLRCASLSPDGATIATGGQDGAVRFWDAATGNEREGTLKHGGLVWVAAYCQDGRQMLTGSADQTLRLWDVATRQPLCDPLPHEGMVIDAAILPDGSRAVAVGGREARIWRFPGGHLAGVLPHPLRVFQVALDARGEWAVTGCEDNVVRLWDVGTAKQIGPGYRHSGAVHAVALLPGGRGIVSCSAHESLGRSTEGTARLWPIPEPLRGDTSEVVRWAEVLTGFRLDPHGTSRPLSAVEWSERLGGLPRHLRDDLRLGD